jgi:hypothetical protein
MQFGDVAFHFDWVFGGFRQLGGSVVANAFPQNSQLTHSSGFAAERECRRLSHSAVPMFAVERQVVADCGGAHG